MFIKCRCFSKTNIKVRKWHDLLFRGWGGEVGLIFGVRIIVETSVKIKIGLIFGLLIILETSIKNHARSYFRKQHGTPLYIININIAYIHSQHIVSNNMHTFLTLILLIYQTIFTTCTMEIIILCTLIFNAYISIVEKTQKRRLNINDILRTEHLKIIWI